MVDSLDDNVIDADKKVAPPTLLTVVMTAAATAGAICFVIAALLYIGYISPSYKDGMDAKSDIASFREEVNIELEARPNKTDVDEAFRNVYGQLLRLNPLDKRIAILEEEVKKLPSARVVAPPAAPPKSASAPKPAAKPALAPKPEPKPAAKPTSKPVRKTAPANPWTLN